MESYTLLLSVLILLAYNALLSHFGKDNIIQALWLIYLKFSSNSTIKQLHKVKLDRKQIQIEKNSISPQDQYAKWTKLNRENDELNKKIENLETQIGGYQSNFQSLLSRSFQIIYWLPMIIFRVWYRKTVIFWLPNDMLPWVFEKGLSWPGAPIGGVGLSQWIFLLNTFIGGILFIQKTLSAKDIEKPVQPGSKISEVTTKEQ